MDDKTRTTLQPINPNFGTIVYKRFMQLTSDERKPIKVYARVRPLNEEEKSRGDAVSVEKLNDEKRIKIYDEKHSQETTYHFDGVFSGTDSNAKVYERTTQHLLTKLLNGINCALLTYGQTGSGKTYTLMADGCITEYAVQELFEKIASDKLHKYKITCSFVQVYLEKVYDLLKPGSKELPVREHPKKGVYVSDLTHHLANTEEEVFTLFRRGRHELVTAETKMVRHSSRSHSIFQLSVERRLDHHLKNEVPTISCESAEVDGVMVLEEDMVLRGKMDICDLAGSERLGKTMVEGIHLNEARNINSSLLELGNVINALSEGKRRHIPFRNSTLTRLLQECLGSRCQTSFIVCVAPSSGESYETRCSLNFGTRARTITNKERMCLNVEFDYKVLAKKLSKRVETLELELQSARPIRDFISSSLNLHNASIHTQTDSYEQNDKRSTLYLTQYTFNLSQMLDCVLESCENRQLNHFYPPTQDSPALHVVAMATSTIEHVRDNTPCDVISSDVMHVVAESAEKMARVRREMAGHAGGLGASHVDLFVETAYMISEMCEDVEAAIATVASKHSQCDKGSWQKLVQMIVSETNEEKDDNLLTQLQSLLTVLHVLQVTRLLFESPNTVSSPKLLKNEEAVRWREKEETPCEDKTWTEEDPPKLWTEGNQKSWAEELSVSSNEDAYFSDFSSITDSLRFEQIKADQLRKENEFLRKQHEQRQNSSFISLCRSQSFKVKGEMNWRIAGPVGKFADQMPARKFADHISEASSPEHVQKVPRVKRSKVQASGYPVTQTKRFAYIEDGTLVSPDVSNGDEIDAFHLKMELKDLEKRHSELLKKFRNLVTEKECLTEKLQKLQTEKMTLLVERDYARRQVDSIVQQRVEENDALDQLQDEYTRMHDTLSIKREESEEHRATLDNLQNDLAKRNLIVESLRQEIETLKAESKRIENESKNEMLKIAEDQCKQKEDNSTAFAKQMLAICAAFELITEQDPVKRNVGQAEDISSLENELYKITEHLVRYEVVIKDIRNKSDYFVKHCQLPPAMTESPTEEGRGKKVVAKVVSQRTPAHLAKKMNALKKEQRKLVANVRTTYAEQPISSAKEIKVCRASRLKEVVQEKVEMAEKVTKLQEELAGRDKLLAEKQLQIDLLVQELATVDQRPAQKTSHVTDNQPMIGRENTMVKHQPVVARERTTFDEPSKQIKKTEGRHSIDITIPLDGDDDIEIIKIPEINYKDLLKFFESQKAENTEEEMVPIGELEALQRENQRLQHSLSVVNDKYDEMLKSGENSELAHDNSSLRRKLDFVNEAQEALQDENRVLKLTCAERKAKLQEMKENNKTLVQELETAKRNGMAMQSRSDGVRQKLDRKLLKAREKINSLQQHNNMLTGDIEVLRKERFCFDDSGLAQDDSDVVSS